MDQPVGSGVGAGHVGLHADRRQRVAAPARREVAQHVARGRVDIRLVEGDPLRAHVAEDVHGAAREAQEERHRVRVGEPAQVLEPDRVVEVMQRHHRLDPALAQGDHHLAVSGERSVVEAPDLGLDARPVDRHPQRGQAQVPREVEVPFRVLPPVASDPAAVAGLDVAEGLPARPGARRPAGRALALVGRGRHAPAEAVREPQGLGYGTNTPWTARTVLSSRLSMYPSSPPSHDGDLVELPDRAPALEEPQAAATGTARSRSWSPSTWTRRPGQPFPHTAPGVAAGS